SRRAARLDFPLIRKAIQAVQQFIQDADRAAGVEVILHVLDERPPAREPGRRFAEVLAGAFCPRRRSLQVVEALPRDTLIALGEAEEGLVGLLSVDNAGRQVPGLRIEVAEVNRR